MEDRHVPWFIYQFPPAYVLAHLASCSDDEIEVNKISYEVLHDTV